MQDIEFAIKNKTETVILGLGSNLGDRFNNILSAIIKLAEEPEIDVIACSSLYESSAVGFEAEPFFNATIAIACSISPLQLLNITQQIEISSGRRTNKDGARNNPYQSRKIDIDILFYGNTEINTPRLIIPHPEINSRLFVRKTLKDLNFLLPSLCLNKEETNIDLLPSQEVKVIIPASERLQTELRGKQLLK